MFTSTRISKSGFFIILLSYFIFSLFLIFGDKSLLYKITKEDGIIEYLGAFFLFLTSLLLFLTCFFYLRKNNKTRYQKIIFIFFALAFFLAAGEEISWGQRVFDFKTPQYLKTINDQNEINLHNIDKKFSERLYQHAITLFIIFCTSMFFLKKSCFWNITMPDVFTIYSFMLIPFCTRYDRIQTEYFIGSMLIFLFLSHYFLKHKYKMFFVTLLTILVMSLIAIIHYNYIHKLWLNGAAEYREYMFSFICFIYALYLFLTYKEKNLLC